MSERVVELEVLRYNPETDSEPRFQRYSVACRDEWVVLDALNHVKETIDPTLSYRWSCHMAVCGSCGMMVNREPKLACKAFLRDYQGVIRVEPLAHFPIERDLVTVIDDFMDKLKRVRPYLIPKQERPVSEGEYRQTPAELKKFKQYSMCINCMLCYAACPEYGLIPKYIGRRRSRWRTATTRIRATADATSASRRSRRPRARGNARSSAPAPRSVPSTWIRRAPFSRSRSRVWWTGTRST